MDPLSAIKQWYDSGIQSMREELVFLLYKFHPEQSVSRQPSQQCIREFEAYMDSTGLTKTIIMQRAIFIKGLISFGLCGRDTEEGWERARQKNEQVDKLLAAAGLEGRKLYSGFMNGYSLRKAQWIAWSNVWRGLEQDVLSDENIGYWYYVAEAVKERGGAVKL